MEKIVKDDKKEALIKTLFEVGAHFGFSRRRRHPSVNQFLYGYKNNSAIIDLTKTTEALAMASDFVKDLGRNRATILFVGNKPEARLAIKKAALACAMPYVALRWIGGTFTNFKQIRKRVERLLWLTEAETSGELTKYTKKERLLFAKERKKLTRYFEGITNMDKLPQAIYIVDPAEEATAVAEAKQIGRPIIALANSDCDIRNIDFPIVANDTAKTTITFFTEKIAEAYQIGLKEAPIKADLKTDTETLMEVEAKKVKEDSITKTD